ncbi:hypothetical protein C8R46DRAFT_1086503 [Mycena filopes]|nr:hypothetical protein C8R46DRAFT_1086503 [Mycena filopes]
MTNFLATLRYFIFAVFIICCSIIASVAVWNASLREHNNRDVHIDTYLVVVGALGLALTFTVWFEILWTATFFLLDLGMFLLVVLLFLTAVGPDDMCKPPKHGKALPGSCSSSRVLTGFTWFCACILLIYLVLLLLLTVINRNNESVPRIWQCTIHNFPPLTASHSTAPVLPRFSRDKMTEIVTPAPQRPNTVPSALYSAPGASDPASPVASPADYLHSSPSNAGTVRSAVTLYPQFLSSAYVPQPPPVHTQPLQASSPSPLGDWPRTNPPLRTKRKIPATMGVAAGIDPVARPMGPRTRSPTTNTRPPPLDLSSISAHRDRERSS